MDAWRGLCRKAFDGDDAANHLILYLEGCGKLLPSGQFSVTATSLNDADRACLKEIEFVPPSEQENSGSTSNGAWTLPGDQWSHYIEAKRDERVQWHEARQQQFRVELNTHLETIQPLTGINDQHRLALVTEFCKRFGTDVGAIPFLRGLVGFCRFQLFKDKLADWRCYEYVLTQSGTEAMVEYIKLLKGVLQFELVVSNDNSKKNNDQVVLDMRGGSSSAADPILVWRMNNQLSDRHLSDILAILPREQSVQGYTLSDTARPVQFSASIGFHHPQFLLQWILHLFRHCLGFISRTRRK